MQLRYFALLYLLLLVPYIAKPQPPVVFADGNEIMETRLFISNDEHFDIPALLSSGLIEKFQSFPEKYLMKSAETYWILMTLDSAKLTPDTQWYISFDYWDKIEMFYQDTSAILSCQAGLRNKENDPAVDDLTNIPIQKDQLIRGKYFIARVKDYKNRYFLNKPSLVNQETLAFYHHFITVSSFKRNLPYFLFIGGISLMIVYFLGIFFLYRDRLFIIYSAYLLSLLLYLGTRTSIILEFLMSSAPFIHPLYNTVIQVIVNICYLVFSIAFLNAQYDFPKLYQFIKVSIYLLVFVVILQLSIYAVSPFTGWEETILNVERYYMIVFSLGAYVYILRKYKKRIVLFFLAGSFTFLLGGVTALLLKDIQFMMYGAAIEVFIFSLGMGYRTRQIELEKKSIESEIAKTELSALKAQMNPHFIFNSLNSIRAYVISNEINKASEYITKFSKLIRLILYYSAKENITLREEADTLALYVQLEELRFREDFGFEINIAPGIDTTNVLVPPLIIQPYIENAIRHGLAPSTRDKKLELFVATENSKIIIRVKDNGVGRRFSQNHTSKPKGHQSMAMDLTKKRIDLIERLHTREENIIINDLYANNQAAGTEVTLKLPLVELQPVRKHSGKSPKIKKQPSL
ncbi:hypothetical protein D1614_16835 [Maribellus luteus]|uniref:Signal transduction histidine kinase internal region domain-containing protein n=1 Tax=Maribellus luteus TaxID=2305463 RepID=A0A399STX3_9BACT|nr:histidine kinase [Maribellus luteus]RIJ46828.1 hypothetical protein D1614_16835 [Maribellus luteus]